MQDQGKRLLLAVALALGFMLVWNKFWGPKEEDPKPEAGSGSAAVAGPVAPASEVGKSTEPSPASPSSTAEAPRGAEQKIVMAFAGKFTATFSSYGGALVSFKLADPRFERDQTKGEMLPGLPGTGAFLVDFAKSTYALPRNAEWTGTKVSDTQVKYTLSTELIDIEKLFTVLPDTFLVRMVVTANVKVPAGKIATQQLAVSAFAFQDPAKAEDGESSQSMARAWFSSSYSGDEILHTPVTDVIEWPRYEPAVIWAGFEHPYLLGVYAPKPAIANEYTVEKYTFPEDPKGLMRSDLLYVPALQMKQGDKPIVREIVGYLGPKNYTSLDRADAATEFKPSPGFKETIDLGWFGFIGKPLLWLLQQFYSAFGNWGIAIILLTFLVKAATLYWTTKSMRSMKAMAALTPQMKALQEKYKNDRQRLQAETMALYKTHNVNPIAGCLPILMQMPIWLALYRMLSSAGELYQQPFIPGWIDDLTAPDPYKILPIILMVTMFLQARLTPQTGTSGQQKMIMYGMPLMFGVMSFFFPAGLTLYIFTNTCLSALHSIWMNKYDKKSLELVAKMKANQEAVEAAKAAAEKATTKGSSSAKNGAPKSAKPVIDVESVESTSDEDDDGAPAEAAASSTSATPRPRKKKKRRR
ncbi:MAG: membrane protein insertase YidC [Deltaproteobacteria bacterium]|nr:membrane protein insertase YidC [Deltaproteobacteria bacterium]